MHSRSCVFFFAKCVLSLICKVCKNCYLTILYTRMRCNIRVNYSQHLLNYNRHIQGIIFLVLIQLLTQSHNTGVTYQYYVPIGFTQSDTFIWNVGSYGDCSVDCGGGKVITRNMHPRIIVCFGLLFF